MRSKIKITVLKRLGASDLFDELPVTPVSPAEACGIYEDGQEFMIDTDLKLPENFCESAWNSIRSSIVTLSYGGNFPWFKEQGVDITCCNDGLRPVIFKLERV